MNIVITLPTNLIEEIFIGNKTVEIRRTLPIIAHQGDRVYIIEKGTPFIIGYVTISAIYYDYTYEIWNRYKDRICVDKRWFEEYVRGKEIIGVIEIKKPVRYKPTYHREILRIVQNPQSFFYTNKIIENE